MAHTKVEQGFGAWSYSQGPSKVQSSQKPTPHKRNITDYLLVTIIAQNGISQLPLSFLPLCLSSKLKNKNRVWQTTSKSLLILVFQLVLYHQNREVKKRHLSFSSVMNSLWNKMENKRHTGYCSLNLNSMFTQKLLFWYF